MDWHEGFEVYGEKGSIVAKTYNPWTFKSSDVEIFKTEDDSYHRPIAVDGHFYRRQIEDFFSGSFNWQTWQRSNGKRWNRRNENYAGSAGISKNG